ncbi:MAG: helix-turn-helix domain-containing protein [Candidatus Dojkabacteria bacterium]|nr:helix-turn-helix domain-containing protein [Candidatus Dojkabacteria bacterium]
MNEKKLSKFLLDLGLDRFEVKIYLVLVKRGALTILEIARESKVDRSKVYRRLEEMKKIGVVEEIIDEKKKLAQAVGVERLEMLLKDKEAQMIRLKEEFPSVKAFLSANIGLNDPQTRVLFYRGKRGTRQMIWNVLRLKGEGVGYTYGIMGKYVGKKFVERWGKEFRRRRLSFRHIFSDHYLENLAKEGIKGSWGSDFFQGRYVPQKLLDITHQVDIYNDVVAFYGWHKDDVFGIEIYNKQVVKFQRQLFEIIWKMGKDPEKLEEKLWERQGRKGNSK